MPESRPLGLSGGSPPVRGYGVEVAWFKKWLAMEDAIAWMNHRSVVEQEIERAADA